MKRLTICMSWMLALALFSGWFGGAAVAADKEPATKKPAAVKEVETTAEEAAADRYKVPDGDSADLLKFIDSLRRFRPTTREEYVAHKEKSVTAIKAAAEKILATEKDKDSNAYKKASALLFESRMRGLANASPAEQKKLLAELSDRLLSEHPVQEELLVARSIAQELEFGGKPEVAAELYTLMAPAFAKSDNPQLAAMAGSFEGAARRLSLLGKPVELSGTTMDGEKFDWASYRGKVVLIDFWATWCGPCVGEIPNVVKNYEAYHDKGFDVVGISLDNDRGALEKFLEAEKTPWTTLHEKDGQSSHPMATYYGVSGIPTVLLVDKDGKCVSLNARGPELGRLLKEQLGEPAPAKEEDSKDDDSKEKNKDAKSKENSSKEKAAETK